jgi:hypothetical protein
MLGAEDVKKIQLETPVTTEPAVITEAKPQDILIPAETAKMKVAEMFNINSYDVGKYEHDINRILEYVNSFNPQNVDDIVYYIKSLGARLGTNSLEKQIKTISRYLFLNNQKQQIDRDIERMTNVPNR